MLAGGRQAGRPAGCSVRAPGGRQGTRAGVNIALACPPPCSPAAAAHPHPFSVSIRWQRLVEPLVAAGIPYAICLGNHDLEANLGARDLVTLDQGCSELSLTQHGRAEVGGGRARAGRGAASVTSALAAPTRHAGWCALPRTARAVATARARARACLWDGVRAKA
jgi:hypothetical protein